MMPIHEWLALKLGLFCPLALCLVTAAFCAQTPPPVPKEDFSLRVERCTDYAAAYARALKEDKPLVVWVGQPVPRAERGCVQCTQASFPGLGGRGCVVSRPQGGRLLRLADLPGTPTSEEIRSVLEARAQRVPANLRETAGERLGSRGFGQSRSRC